MSSITGNTDDIFINNANLKIVKPNKGLIFADGTVLYTANTFNTQNLLANIYQFTNVQTAFVINEVTANTGFAGNATPTDAISVSSNLFISYTGNLITYGQITAGSVANVESNILNLETSNGLVWSNISSLQNDVTDNSSRISFYESNVHLEGFNVGISPSSFTPLANLHVVGNVYVTTNVEIGGLFGDGTLANLSANILNLEISNGLVWSNISSLQNDVTDNSSRISFYESNIHLEGFNVGISPSSFTPLANLHVVGNVYVTTNVEIGGLFGDGTLANLSANILNLEISNGLVWSNISSLQNDVTDNSSRISFYESNIHLEGFNVGISPSSFTPLANLHVVGNVYVTTNVEIGGLFGDGTLANLSANILNLEISNGLVWSNISSLQNDVTDNSSRISFYESNIHLEGFNVGISPSSFTPLANLHVVGNVYVTTNVEIGGLFGDGTLANLSANILNLETSNGLVWSNISSLQNDVTDNSSRISFYESNIHLEGFNVGISPSSFTPLANLHVVGNVYVTTNVEIGGLLGIGTTSPGYKLDVTGVASCSTLRIDGGTGSSFQAGAIYTDGNWGMLFRASAVATNTGASEFAWFSAPGDGTELMRMKGGNLGIGSTSPYAKLHVNGTGGTLNGVTARFFNYGTVLSSSTSANFGSVSIFASEDIVAGGWIASTSGTIGASDRRIKSNIQDINDTLALEQLRLLKPKTYQYKDTIKRGTESVIGFIAQEVNEVIPTAVTIRTQNIPNIYELVNVYQSNVITFANFNTSNLNATSNSNIINIKTVTGSEERVTLANVIDEHTIQVVEDLTSFTGSVDDNGNVITETITTTYTQEEYDALESNALESNALESKNGINITYTPEITKDDYEALTDEEKEVYTLSYSKTETVNVGVQIFVYGQEVDDFNFLKKESIFTIATAALQEVDRQQQADKARIATLESRVETLLTRIEALENNNP